MGKNIVVRLHVYLMCFLLAFSPAYVYASAAPLLDFTGVVNGAKTAGGYVADFLFTRSANDPNYNAANDDRFETKRHNVSNAQMGDTWRDRWSGKTGGIGAGLLATAAIAGLLAGADWILDPANNSIKRKVIEPKYVYCPRTVFQNCSADPAKPFDILKQNFYQYQHTYDYVSHKLPSQDLIDRMKPGSFVGYIIDYTATETTPSRTTSTDLTISAYVHYPFQEDLYVEATREDIAEQVAKASPEILEQLATPASPAEAHAPTAEAAAKAEPAAGSDACPAGQTKVNGVCQVPPSENKCPAGQVFDTTTGKCKSATAAQCPAGQVYDVVKKKCFSPKPDGEDEENPDEWPEFCEWAAPVCDFIEWAKQDVEKFDAEKVEVEDTADDAQSITSQILTLGYVSGGVKACPANYTFTFSVMGQAIDFDLSYKPFCDMLLMARPVVIAIAYFQAAKIVFVGRRD